MSDDGNFFVGLLGLGISALVGYQAGKKGAIKRIEEYERDVEILKLRREIGELKALEQKSRE